MLRSTIRNGLQVQRNLFGRAKNLVWQMFEGSGTRKLEKGGCCSRRLEAQEVCTQAWPVPPRTSNRQGKTIDEVS